MLNLKLTTLTFLLAILSCTTFAQSFTINGKVSGLPDSTWLYIRMAQQSKDIDSTMVINNEFHFTGKISSKTEQAILHTKGYKNYVFFWIENAPISISATAGEFKKAVIKGSTAQDDDNALLAAESATRQREDSINNAYKTTKDTAQRQALDKAFLNARNDEMNVDIAFVRSHPHSLISAYVLSVYASTWEKQTVIDLYKRLDPEMKNTSYGANINEFITLNKDVSIGRKYVDFEESTPDGKLVKLSKLKGKYILLDFWASWCGPCRAENPNLVKTYNEFKNKGFVILSISLDEDKTNWTDAIKHDGLTWENVSDLNGNKNKAALIYGINGIPDNFLIDPNGNIIARNLRGDALKKKLDELTGQSAPR